MVEGYNQKRKEDNTISTSQLSYYDKVKRDLSPKKTNYIPNNNQPKIKTDYNIDIYDIRKIMNDHDQLKERK